MGADYKANAVIGLKVDPKKLFTTHTVKAFEHDMPESMTYHPDTGKKLWQQERRPIPGFAYNYGDNSGTLLGYAVIFVGMDDDTAFICLAQASSSHRDTGYAMTALPLLEGAEQGMFQAKMESLGLWDEKKFGLWVALNGYA